VKRKSPLNLPLYKGEIGKREEGRGKSDFKSHYVEQFLKRNEEE